MCVSATYQSGQSWNIPWVGLLDCFLPRQMKYPSLPRQIIKVEVFFKMLTCLQTTQVTQNHQKLMQTS